MRAVRMAMAAPMAIPAMAPGERRWAGSGVGLGVPGRVMGMIWGPSFDDQSHWDTEKLLRS